VRSVRLRLRGRVQGVGFRAHVEREARRIGVSGWVRNRLDGSVEVAVGGPPDRVDTMVAACRRGPSGALVVEVESEAYGGPPLEGFSVLPTE
jgi:acylphosphatase